MGRREGKMPFDCSFACPHCGKMGTVTIENDWSGKWFECYMCGWEKPVPDPMLVSLGPIPIVQEKRRIRTPVHSGEKIG